MWHKDWYSNIISNILNVNDWIWRFGAKTPNLPYEIGETANLNSNYKPGGNQLEMPTIEELTTGFDAIIERINTMQARL